MDMYKVYETTQTDIVCNDYTVLINGKEVSLNTARVSAMPFNRRWPGHQRSVDQTELVNFLSLQTDEELEFEIIPKETFDTVEIRPVSLGITPVITDDGHIKFTLKKAAYFTVEPYGLHKALHIFADPVKEYDIDINDDNVIYYGKGEHDVGKIVLKSGQTLFIDEGAVVYACVFAVDAENIRICGRGILDNSRNREHILYEAYEENTISAVPNAHREHTMRIEYCTGVEIEGITIRDSLVYNIRPLASKNIHISNVKIIGCWRYNSDGIDMHNCEDVLIENCFLRTYDDSICVKGFDCFYEDDVDKAVFEAMHRNGKSYENFKNVLVRDCVIWNDWGKCLEIGAETRAEKICNIRFTDCDIIHVSGTPLDVMNVDYADVYDVVFENMNVEYDDVIMKMRIQNFDGEEYDNSETEYSPNLISVVVEFHHEYSAGGNRRGINRDITFRNINLYGRHMPKLRFRGYSEDNQTKNIVIENLFWNGEKITTLPDTHFNKGEFTENIVIE